MKLKLILLLVGVTAIDTGKASSPAECTVVALQQKAPPGTTITAAADVPAEGTTPEYCRVDGHVATPGNTVNFRLGLPAAWNGKFFFEGVGGFGGTIGSLNAGLEKGYASASTDTGHQGSVDRRELGAQQPGEANRLRVSRHARYRCRDARRSATRITAGPHGTRTSTAVRTADGRR